MKLLLGLFFPKRIIYYLVFFFILISQFFSATFADTSAVTVTSPNGAESWVRGFDHQISWNDTFLEDVKIELYKGGLFHSVIDASAASDGMKNWDIPDTIPVGNYKIKISKLNDTTVYDYSDSDFAIGSFEVTIPNGGESWAAGTYHQIKWNDVISNSDTVVNLELWKGGVFDRVLFVNQDADGSKGWDIPNDLPAGIDYRIRIIHSNDTTDFDFSDSDFTITEFVPEITVTTPNGGEIWQTGIKQTITWTDNIAEDVKIELYKGGVYQTELFASTSSDGSKFWTIPMTTPTDSDYTIKVTSVDSSSVFDFSDTTFIIYTPLVVTTPNGGENWRSGTQQTITWNDNIAENVKIDLYKAGVLNLTINASTPSDGSYDWDIPAGTVEASNYTIVMTSVDSSSITDVSDANFSIFNPAVTLTSPNGGEIFETGSLQDITWNDNIAEDVKIDLYKAGVFNSTITASTPSDGIYNWTVPSVTGASDYTVVITSTTEGTVTDISDAGFTIQTSAVTVTSPNGAESWVRGFDHQISWNDTFLEDVKIELYKGGLFHSVIDASAASDGMKNWDIPDTIPVGNYKIKISKVNDTTVYDYSDSDFFIGSFEVTIPNGGESWAAGTYHQIKWKDVMSNSDTVVNLELWKGGVFDRVLFVNQDADGSKGWDIPNDLPAGTDYRIRIIHSNDTTDFDFSDSDFTITEFVPEITITTPNGGEIWQTGIKQTITWTDNIAEDVKIELYKGGVYQTELFASTSSDGSKFWTIPMTTPTDSDYTIKVISVESSSVFDFSDTTFIIYTPLVLTTPNGGENWRSGTQQTITWNDNITEDVKIELFKADVFNSIIVASTPSDGSYDWDIPAGTVEASNYTIVMTSVDSSSITDVSDANFSIFNPAVTLTSPNGGEIFETGSLQDITWNDNIAEDVKIDLYKAGVFNSTITASTPSDGIYNWTVPSVTGASDYTVVITSTTEGTVTDISDAGFTIQTSDVTVTSPNGAESWVRGFDHQISWNDTFLEDVKIELYKGGLFHSVIDASAASDGMKNWDIPDTIPVGNYKIKISKLNDTTVYDYSDSDFAIGSFEVTIPNGGESWAAGTYHQIKWNDVISNSDTVVNLELWKGGVFDRVLFVNQDADGSKGWDIPNDLPAGTDYRIRIIHSNDTTDFDFSDSDFTISEFVPEITITTPNGGEIWQTGIKQTITWTDNIAEDVKIELYKGGVYQTELFASTSSDGSKFWTIPMTTPTDSDYTIKVTSVDSSSVFDFSDTTFIIYTPLVVTTPNGGENWRSGTQQTITWNDNIAENVKIDLYKAGVLNLTINASTPSDGSYDWDIPAGTLEASNYTIVMTSVDSSSITDVSDANFSIFNPAVTLTSPNGGEIFETGSLQDITWNDNIAEDVKIDLYKAGVFNSTITASTPSDGIYNWTVPSVTGASDYTVVITSTTEGTVTDISDAGFTIQTSAVTVTSPNGAESWVRGFDHQISWNDTFLEDVKIELYKGGLFHSVIDASAASDGMKNWDIPDTIPVGNYKIKISKLNDTTVYDYSDSDFAIGSFEVTIPNGGESWAAGTYHQIKWNDVISNSDTVVNLELWKGGVFDRVLFVNQDADGSKGWDIPNDLPAGIDYRIRIIHSNDSTDFDFSDSDFTITEFVPEITVTTPNGGEIWQTGIKQTITWTDNIAEDVKIELYKGGVYQTELFASTSSDGSKFWTIPMNTESGADYTIKITSVDSSSVFDFSDTTFTIFTTLAIFTPNGGESWLAGTQQTITWNDNITEDVKIELFKAGVFNSIIVASTPSDGSYDWDIPAGTVEASNYAIVMTSVDSSSITDVSDANFSIFNPAVTLTSPNGGESWRAGIQQTITWNDNITEDVKIELYKAGVFNSTITASTPSDGSHDWSIPAGTTAGSDYTIMITSLDTISITDVSDSEFSITTVSFNTYVDKNASGLNNGSCWTDAYEKFSDIDWNHILPGDTVLVSGGVDSTVYTTTEGNEEEDGRSTILLVKKAGTSGNQIVIRPGLSAGHNGKVIFDGQNIMDTGISSGSKDYITIEYFTLRGFDYYSVRAQGSDYSRFEHLNILVEGRAGISGKNGDFNHYAYNYITTPNFVPTQTDGIYVQWCSYTKIHNNIIIINNTHQTGHDDCIQMVEVTGMMVYNNYCEQNNSKVSNAQGIVLAIPEGGSEDTTYFFNNVVNMTNAHSNPMAYNVIPSSGGSTAESIQIMGNIIYGVGAHHGIWVSGYPNHATVRNNISFFTDGAVIPATIEATSLVMDHNILKSNSPFFVRWDSKSYSLIEWQALGKGTDSFNTDPMFSNISERDFSSKDGSIAIDNGIVTHVYDVDLNNTPRPQGSDYDIGSYERAPNPFPVELSSFIVTVMDCIVKLNWRTETEVNNYGFDVERIPLSPPIIEAEKDGGWEKIGFVEGHGNSNSPKDYSFSDENVAAGKYSYRLKQIDNDGTMDYSDEIEVEVNGPLTFNLQQNFPNPFNPSTIIKYSVPENGFIKLSVYNLIAEEVSVLINEQVDAGFYELKFNAVSLPSGVYFYRLQAGNYIETKKMVLLR